MLRRNRWKNIVIIILAVIIAGETLFLAIGKSGGSTRSADPSTQYVLTLSMDGMGASVGNKLGAAVTETVNGLLDGKMPAGGITGLVKGFVYSDMVVNAVMSVSYPLLLRVLIDIDLIDFATAAKLYPRPALLAGLLEGKPYTCCDASGARKPLSEVLSGAGEDWTFFDSKINWTDDDGTAMSTTVWNSIKWNITDEASFFTAMNDMGEGLRGVLEICLQNNEVVPNVNVFEALMGKPILPISLDAAVLFNGTGASGYSTCLIPLFNMLGLDDGEYMSDADFRALTNVGEMWKAIFDPIMSVVAKTEKDPVNGLMNMLVNFASQMDSGELVKSMKTLRLDADFNDLAALAMGYKDGLLSNLGDLLIEVIESLGIKFSGSFNELLDSLPGLIPSIGAIDLPDMDVAKLTAGATEKTLASGSKVLVADAQSTLNYLVEYAVNEQIAQIIFDKTDFLSADEEAAITGALANSKDGIKNLAQTAVPIILAKLNKAA